ncbi:MAG: asparagine synthase (glutamine-hydrolyzing) [Acidobacteriota bacterium]|nr:asparagine synthase (glutamine-hydrolyzing) [Acidobacteriota bacterium]
MCGIAGVLAFDHGVSRVSEPLVTAMRETLRHRGPDGGDTWVDPTGRIGLGHRRLSIIDLATSASQPMANEDGNLRIVFNGEIYNHLEVRAELSKSGRHRWLTDHSDTEVILHGFEEWGIDVVHRLRGMFAFALWDAREQALWLVRDRIGIKPLYYSVDANRLTFGSEIKALLEVPGQRRAVHEEALFHYLSFLTTPGNQTLFDGILKMSPGTWLRATADGRVTQKRYWDVWDAARPIAEADDASLAERILDELRISVRLRKVSDVPVGVFLSGGLDSSTNAALFSEGESRPVRTFSIGYDRDYPGYANELHFARSMAERIGAEHHERRLTRDDVVEFLPRMVHLQDEPIADPVCVPVHYVAKLARESGTIVCQLGEGADELFIGYPNWLQALERQEYDDLPVPRFVKGMAAAGLKAAGYDHAWQYEYLRRGSRGEPLFWGGAESFPDAEKRRLLGSRLRNQFKDLTSWDALAPIRADFLSKAHETSNLNWMSYIDLRLRLPELLLMRVDKMTMGVGLEARVPFLDHEFVTMAMSIPSARKAPNGRLKHLLKTAVKGLVPAELIERRKQGFGVPVDDLFAGRLAQIATKELTRFCDETGLLDKQAALHLVGTGQGSKTWYLLNLAMWWRHFIAGEALEVE